jgi:hypothetical protein
MLRLVPTQRLPLAVISGGLGATAKSDPLLAFAGAVTGSHALVIAPNGLNLLCSLLRHGCAAATSLRLAERCDHEAYDLVFAPSVTSTAPVARLICQAKRALVPTGRFLAFVPASALDHHNLGEMLVQCMRLNGFAAVRCKATKDGRLVRGDLPMHGLSNAMPSLTRRHA